LRGSESSFFANISSRIKKFWGNKEESTAAGVKQPTSPTPPPAPSPSPPTSDYVVMSDNELGEMSAEEQQQEELTDKKLLEAIEAGKFDMADYNLEVKRMLKLAKIKGAYDGVKSTVKSKFTGLQDKEKEAYTDMINSFSTQIKILDAMKPEELKNPEIFANHSFKIKLRVCKDSGTDVSEFNRMLQNYHGARAVYMVMHAAKKAGKEIPTNQEALMQFARDNAHLLPKKELEMWKNQFKNIQFSK